MQEKAQSTQSILTAGALSVGFEQTPDGIRYRACLTGPQTTSSCPPRRYPVYAQTASLRNEGGDPARRRFGLGPGGDGVYRRRRRVELAAGESGGVAHRGSHHDRRRSAPCVGACEWTSSNPEWSVWRVIFPGRRHRAGSGRKVFFPRAPGEVQTGLWQREFHHQGPTPSPDHDAGYGGLR